MEKTLLPGMPVDSVVQFLMRAPSLAPFFYQLKYLSPIYTSCMPTTYKYKYNVEVQNIYERLCIEETGQQLGSGSFNNQCGKKWTTVKQSIKSSLNAGLPRKANRKKQKWMTDHTLNLMENRKQF